MKKKIRCNHCYSTGQDRKWITDNKVEIIDCPKCDGEGFVEITFVDKRKFSKKKEIEYPSSA